MGPTLIKPTGFVKAGCAPFTTLVLIGFSLFASSILMGCRTTAVATRNLDAVLSSSDNFRYQGDTTTPWKDFWAFGLGNVSGGLLGRGEKDGLKPITNPTEFALENLVELAESGQGPAIWRENEQVRVLTRFARHGPSKLVRERALLELAGHAKRLGLDRSHAERADAVEVLPANAPELIEALDGLVDAARRILGEGATASETARLDFDAAVSLLEGTKLNIQGGSRLLRALGPFLRSVGLPDAAKDRLAELSLSVQKELVAEALHFGAYDPSSLARAGALQAGVEVFGEEYLIEATLALLPPGYVLEAVRARHQRFAIPPVPASFVEVHLAVSQALRDAGLPVAACKGTRESLELKGTLMSVLWRVSVSDVAFTDRSRHAMMRALAALSGGELETLRSEEWDVWFEARIESLALEIERVSGGAPEEQPAGTPGT